MNKSRGFTLVELLVVVAIIALLVAILVPSLMKARELTHRTVCVSNLHQIGLGMILYADYYNGELPDNYRSDLPYVAYYNSYRDSTGKLIPVRLACLYEAEVAVPKIFYCLSAPEGGNAYERYCSPPPWGTLPQDANQIANGGNGNQFVRTAYAYYPQARKKDWYGFPLPATETTKMKDLDPHKSMVTDRLNSWSALNHKSINPLAICAVFPDGHASICTDEEAFDRNLWFNGNAQRNLRPNTVEFKTILSVLTK